MSNVVFFFFSSRRRHTRFDCDWSSDVCSSDLAADHANGRIEAALQAARQAAVLLPRDAEVQFNLGGICLQAGHAAEAERAMRAALALRPHWTQIGRAHV